MANTATRPTSDTTSATARRTRCDCGGRLAREEYFACGEWHETLQCIACGREPGVRRDPTAEERAVREGHDRAREERAEGGTARRPRGGREQQDAETYQAIRAAAEAARVERRRQERARALPGTDEQLAAVVDIDGALDATRALDRHRASIAADPQQQAERERARALLDAVAPRQAVA